MGSVRLGRESFRFPCGMVRTSGAVGMFHTTSFRPHPPCHHPFETSRIHGSSHCGLMEKSNSPQTTLPWFEGCGQQIFYKKKSEKFFSGQRNFTPCHKSNVDLGCFCVLAIVKSAATNIGVQVFFKLLFPQGICPVMGLLADVVILVLIFYAE